MSDKTTGPASMVFFFAFQCMDAAEKANDTDTAMFWRCIVDSVAHRFPVVIDEALENIAPAMFNVALRRSV